ncbi:MAG TPA: GIY-YIG nuclease family protein [Flavisolibacter sp.]|nr:GIY-YIG nuclease family protein [Flavisolibacter sp.]
MSYYVYILKSLKDGKYYIGSTSDVVARLNFHNSGLQRSTKSRIPFVLIYQEELPDKTSALKREKQVKNYKGGEAFKRLLRDVAPPEAGH